MGPLGFVKDGKVYVAVSHWSGDDGITVEEYAYGTTQSVVDGVTEIEWAFVEGVERIDYSSDGLVGEAPWADLYWAPPQLGGQFWTEFSRAREDATTLGVGLDLGINPPGPPAEAVSELTPGDFSGMPAYVSAAFTGGAAVGDLVPATLAGRTVVMLVFQDMDGDTGVQLALEAPADVGDQESFSGGSLLVDGVTVSLTYEGAFPGPGGAIYGFSGVSATLPMPTVGAAINVALTLSTA